MEVIVHDGDLDGALRELKKKILRDGIFKEIKSQEDCKPSIKRREKKRKALRRLNKRRMRKEERC